VCFLVLISLESSASSLGNPFCLSVFVEAEHARGNEKRTVDSLAVRDTIHVGREVVINLAENGASGSCVAHGDTNRLH